MIVSDTGPLIVDEGEAEAIALGLERGSWILIDERKGRICARSLNLNVRVHLVYFLKPKRET